MTMVTSVSKSHFKAHALRLFREVERTGQPLVITDRGVPVLTLAPYRAPGARGGALRDTVMKYDAPTRPVGEDDWDAAR